MSYRFLKEQKEVCFQKKFEIVKTLQQNLYAIEVVVVMVVISAMMVVVVMLVVVVLVVVAITKVI